MQNETIKIADYLVKKGIAYKEKNNELLVKCLFSSCDDDSRSNEYHLYFNKEDGTYHCKKCDAKGNIFTLCDHLGDNKADLFVDNKHSKSKTKTRKKESLENKIAKCFLNLPDNIRDYLNNRGISNSTIEKYKIGYGKFYNSYWIVIPIYASDNRPLFLKLRSLPSQGTKTKYIYYPKGSETSLYGHENFNLETLFICEGELDRLILEQSGIPAITSTSGCATFDIEWLHNFKKLKQLHIVFDNDEAGKRSSKKLAYNILENNPALDVCLVTLPRMLNGKDITDYYLGNNNVISKDALLEHSTLIESAQSVRVTHFDMPENPVSIEDLKQAVTTNFPDLLFSAELGLSVLAQLLINDITNPFALIFIGPPSSGKTITVNFFANIDALTYTTDKYSSAAFVSHAANKKKEDLAKIDLLPRIRHKMLLIRDFAPLFSKRFDDLNESMGILTRVLDGEGYTNDSGVHGQRGYVGDYLFMLLGATTPVNSNVWDIMATLGSRLLFSVITDIDKDIDQLSRQLLTSPYKRKEQKCRYMTEQYIKTLWSSNQYGIEWDKAKDSENIELIKVIGRCAKFLASLRGRVEISREKNYGETSEIDEVKFFHSPPVIEKPDRLNSLFYNLARGHAVLYGRNYLELEDLTYVVAVMLDSAEYNRSSLIKALLLGNKTILSTSEIEKILNCSKPFALNLMEELKALGVCDKPRGIIGGSHKEYSIRLSKDFDWFNSEEFKEIANKRN